MATVKWLGAEVYRIIEEDVTLGALEEARKIADAFVEQWTPRDTGKLVATRVSGVISPRGAVRRTRSVSFADEDSTIATGAMASLFNTGVARMVEGYTQSYGYWVETGANGVPGRFVLTQSLTLAAAVLPSIMERRAKARGA